MIHIIDPTSYHLYSDVLAHMFKLRKLSFFDRRQWDVTVEGDIERDIFDICEPVYVVNANSAGRVLGSLRLLPTTGPHMLADVFNDIMDGENIVRHPLIWESSRFNVDTQAIGEFSEQSVNHATGELLAGLFEAAELIGLQQIVSVYDVAVGRILKRAGCSIAPLGRKIYPGGLPTVAGLFSVGAGVSAEIRRRANLETSPLDRGGSILLKSVA